MSRKEQYADEIIAKLEELKGGYWNTWIDKRSKDAVIEVCQNVVEDWCGRATDHVKTLAEQEPCEDAVSRRAVDKRLTELLSGYLYDEERERLENFCAYLWELPSVQPTKFSTRCPECGAWFGYNLEGDTE